MEVLLRKYKITTSILKQTLRSTEVDLNVGEILGWCLYGKAKYIVCYRSDINSLSIFPLFREISVEPKYNGSEKNKSYVVAVKLGGNFIPLEYQFSDEDGKSNFIETLEHAKEKAENKGQFYI